MKIKQVVLFLFFISSLVNMSVGQVSSMPRLAYNNGIYQLMVNDEPYLILGGELMNSSGFDLDYMDNAWGKVAELNVNTIFIPISWQQFEPEEGKFDSSYLETHILNARKHNLKLVILWFGSWKNGVSTYAPEWVLSNTERFPRVLDQNGKAKNVLSIFSEETKRADAKAFQQLLTDIKRIDEKDHTVVMVQVENEVGLFEQSRDFSPQANKAFNENVPENFLDYLRKNHKQLTPHLTKMLGSKIGSGSWEKMFGSNLFTDELFMAYNYASYIEAVAKNGKSVYPLPIMANAWLDDPVNPVPGKHLSGGPVARVLDAWMAASPNIDIYSPDIYHLKIEDFTKVCADYCHRKNPLLIPECSAIWLFDTLSAPAKAFYSIAQQNAIGFSPFGIDHATYHLGHPLHNAYAVLRDLSDLILEKQGTKQIKGFIEGEEKIDTINMSNYRFVIDYNVVREENELGYGLIIQTNSDEFIFSGIGFNVEFLPEVAGKSGVSILKTSSIRKDKNNQWESYRLNGGDETLWMGKCGLKFPPNPYDIGMNYNDITIQKVKLYRY
ncbi:MAG: DUF5597 domain-containing protein [Bacteroidales bacterium]|nr:DUF5597 domain-containing protein [Bacteroidales bacterium]